MSSSSSWSLPSLSHYSSYDLAILNLVCLHLLFTFVSAVFVLLFHRSSSPSPCRSLRRRLSLLLHLNSLWPVRLLLLLLACLLSLSELLRLPPFFLCNAHSLASHSFAQPAFFATLLFLLRASVKTSSSLSFTFAFSISILAALPFFILQALLIFLSSTAFKKLSLPNGLLTPATGRCTHHLYTTVLLALLGAIYIPLFISACSNAVTVVINKKLRIRLYFLVGTVVATLSVQAISLALSLLWSPNLAMSQVLELVSYVAVLVCVVVGEGILVVQPMVDMLAIAEPEQSACDAWGARDGKLEV